MSHTLTPSAVDLVDTESPSYFHFCRAQLTANIVLDLPPLYTKPSASTLLSILDHFTLPPPSWDRPSASVSAPEGFEKWLVSVIASPLNWIADETVKEAIRDSASERISERCGRSARGEMKRVFRIPLPPPVHHLLRRTLQSALFSPPSASTSPGSSGMNTPTLENEETTGEYAEITLCEPALTADNLGLKTWASSYLLSKRLSLISSNLLPISPTTRALELGAGTGLVGLAAAAIFKVPVLLTDLPEIVPNLSRNIEANAHLDIDAEAKVLDWKRIPVPPPPEKDRYDVVLAADPLYSAEHPQLLVGMIGVWLKHNSDARAVVEMPLRVGYERERDDFRTRMVDRGLEVAEEGVETGWDDWGAEGGEVKCWWSVWKWSKASQRGEGEMAETRH
ncbi:hypothetical protein K440DRAFT_664074 [Wilcoxina mikolae CBS 423.85]|nr:hypothetical protein K440DRAFT_664074 [Wilcoxina mikolae CBS 423.85]